jgi:ribose transport system ATP-binding protein
VLGGIHRADTGQVLIDGNAYHHRPGNFGERQAVAFIHQDLGLTEWMTVAENMVLALGYPRRRGLIVWAAAERLSAAALRRVGCDFDPTTRVQSLSRTEKSLVAIARALAVDCDFLVLDEPTASLPADEVEGQFAALRPLRDSGVGMIYVSHRLDEIFRIADRVVVLRDGAVVGERAIAQTYPEDLVHLIVGRKTRQVVKPNRAPGDVILSLADVRVGPTGPVNLDLCQHEILGLVGLRGAGHEQVSRALFGMLPHDGTVRLDGSTPDLSSPQSVLRAGVGLVARDRTEESVAPSLAIRENTFLNPAAVGRKVLSFLTPRAEAAAASDLGRAVALSPNDPTLAIEALSGGNQQKVVIARWLATKRRLLICEDPTAGVDVGAKAEIYALLNQALEDEVGVIVVSTDFEKVATICHRTLVFSQGAIVAEIAGADITTEALIEAASAGRYSAA